MGLSRLPLIVVLLLLLFNMVNFYGDVVLYVTINGDLFRFVCLDVVICIVIDIVLDVILYVVLDAVLDNFLI